MIEAQRGAWNALAMARIRTGCVDSRELLEELRQKQDVSMMSQLDGKRCTV